MLSSTVTKITVREGSSMEMVYTEGAIWVKQAGHEAESRCARQERGRESHVRTLRGDPRESTILALYGEYRLRLYRYLRSMQLRHEEAEEIVQEAFMRLTMELQKDSEIEIENMPGWIVRVARNLAMNLLKKERGPVLAVETDNSALRNHADTGLTPEQSCIETEQIARMQEEFAKMKPLYRECFQMRAQGFSYTDIGLALGISKQRASFLGRQVAMQLAAVCE